MTEPKGPTREWLLEPADRDTKRHAREVADVFAGTDVVEPPDPALAPARSPLQNRIAESARSWEDARPLEASPPGPPHIAPPSQIDRRHGRPCRLALGRGLAVWLRRR